MTRKMIATRLNEGLVLQFDATAKARGLARTEAMEAAMRAWMNGRVVAAPAAPIKAVDGLVGWDTDGKPLKRRGVAPKGGKK